VTATVHAPPAVVFDLLATPHRHHEIDVSGTVGADEFDEPITKTGQVFRMNMTFEDADGKTEYQTDNLVTKFKANRKIAWALVDEDGRRMGWFWRYDLSPKGKNDQKTLVRLTYDWGDATPETVDRFAVPALSEADLERSLVLLQKAVKGR
jgi:hypothetical protein